MVSSPSRTHLHLPLLTTHAVPSYSRMHEVKRLQAVRRYDVLATAPDGAYDRITALATRLSKVPIAIASIVDAGRIWFKSHQSDQIQREGETVPVACTRAARSEFAQHQGRRYSYRSHSNQKVGRNNGRDNRRREYRRVESIFSIGLMSAGALGNAPHACSILVKELRFLGLNNCCNTTFGIVTP